MDRAAWLGAAAHPVEIGPTEDASRLRIRWSDGHVSRYSPLYLRLYCQCARCVDEVTGDPILEPTDVPGNVRPLAIRRVGSYALRFDWSDGHANGIFPFDLLRSICPCGGCGPH